MEEEALIPNPRKNQVCLDSTSYYHCISRCVRRAFLCGKDEFSGQSYEHRKQWVVDKLAELADVFSLDICAYAVLSSHYHLVFIPDGLPPVLNRLGIEPQTWLDTINHYDRRFFRVVGTMEKIKQFAKRLGKHWLKGQFAGRRIGKQPLPT